MIATDQIYVEFREGTGLINIEPLRFLFPHAELEFDRSIIDARMRIQTGIFSGEFNTNFQINDFELLMTEIQKLETDLRGTVIFQNLDHELKLDIIGDGIRHFEMRCTITPDLTTQLDFIIGFDQTQIETYVLQLGRITDKFGKK